MSLEAKPVASRWLRPAFIAVTTLFAVLGVAVWLFGSPPAMQQAAAIGGPFTLLDGNGRPVTDQTFLGKYMAVYFGYTFCPDVCPTTLNDLSQALDMLGSKAQTIAPVFITLDPARDTPDIVKQYTASFSPRLVGLTGSAEQIAAVAREYRVYYAPHKTGPNPGDYTVDHSSIIYLMGPTGRFVGIIASDSGANRMVTQLAGYLS